MSSWAACAGLCLACDGGTGGSRLRGNDTIRSWNDVCRGRMTETETGMTCAGGGMTETEGE